MIIKHKMSQVQVAKIRKGDIINLELIGSEKKPTEIKVKVVEIVSDIQRCSGCGCKLNEIKVYTFRRKQWCFDCFRRRISEQSEIAQRSANARKKQKPYWNN